MALMLTIKDAAREIAISRSLFYELIAGGKIRVLKVGRRTVVPVAELARFVDELQREQLGTGDNQR